MDFEKAASPRAQNRRRSGEGFRSREEDEEEDSSYRSEYLLSVHPADIKRSASSVTKNRAPIAKPVRRSKSSLHRNNNTSVTNIQHGGPVTFVSVNNGRSVEDLLDRVGEG